MIDKRDETIEKLEKQLGTSKPSVDYINLCQEMANDYKEKKRDMKAIDYLKKAIDHLDSLKKKDKHHLEKLAELSHDIGHRYRQLGRHKPTGLFYQKAIKHYEELYKSPHKDLAASYFILGSFLDQLWKMKPALNYYEKAYSMMQDCCGQHNPQTQAIKTRLDKAIKKSPPQKTATLNKP